jgi:hypothetical protein
VPVIQFRYKRDRVEDSQAHAFGNHLRVIFPPAIRRLRPSLQKCDVRIEGDAFGPVAINQPDIQVNVTYLFEWNLDETERKHLMHRIGMGIQDVCGSQELHGLEVHLTVCEVVGYESVCISIQPPSRA